jgi:hypothetical protein
LNIYGATALGLYYAYLETGNASYFTAMQDAANQMRDNEGIRTASDMQFLMLFDDLPAVSGNVYADTAKARYDYRISVAGSATAFAQTVRDVRGVTQGYPNGIIGWDIGLYVVVAQMLYDRYGASYDADADAMAEVLWQDSYNDNPGLFDVVDDAGWDPTYTDVNYWWYTLGISGLLDAFRVSGSHTSEIPGLVTRLLASQYTHGAISGSYGANANDEDWQSTGYVTRSLSDYDAATYATEIAHGAYWAAVTQDVSGAWKYSTNEHYPEVCAEATYAVTLGTQPPEVWVNDDWTSQADVDAYNAANSTNLLWGYDAFATIQNGIDGVGNSTVNILAGTYVLSSTVNVNKPNLVIDGAGAGQTIVQVAQAVGYAFSLSASGVTLRDIELQKTDVTGLHNLIYIAASNVSILNNLIYGPDPGTPWSVNGIISRAMVSTGGLSGLLIDGNTIRHLRQAGYFSGPTTGTISNNAVSGTRGWVNEGANLAFTGNSWPLPPNQGAEIALLAYAVNPAWYPDLIGLSNANNNAYVDAQFTGGDKGRAVSYVDVFAAPGGFGSDLAPVQTIAAGVAGVLKTGTVTVASGTYNEVNVTISKAMNVTGDPGACGPGAGAPVLQGTGTGDSERGFIISPGTDNVLIDGFVIQNYGGIPNQAGGSCGIWSYGTSTDPVTNVTVQNCEFNHIRWGGIFFYNEGHSHFDNIAINCNHVNMDVYSDDDVNVYGIECTNCKNSEIVDNTVVNGFTGILMTAQALRSTPTTVVVENNEIKGNTVTGSVGWTGNVGIVAWRSATTNSATIRNITIDENVIANSVEVGYGAYGIRAYTSGGGTFADSMRVFNNSFYGNASKSLDNLTSIVWNASGNWWGSADPAAVAASVTAAKIDYTPWLNSPADVDGGTIGFQGDFSYLNVDDGSPQTGSVNRIQEAVDIVSGSTVQLMPGIYPGQVVINGFSHLNLLGSGASATTIQAVASMPHYFSTGSNNFAIVSVENSDTVNISGLTVDGLGLGNTNYRFVGVGYLNSGGTVSDCKVLDVRNNPINGGQHGIGIYAYTTSTPFRTVNVENTDVSGFQKGGITLNGDYTVGNVKGCDVDGYGPAAFIAMNGIQLGWGATGTILDNDIYGCSYTGAGWSSAGVLLYNATANPGSVLVRRNLVEECQIGINFLEVGGMVDSNTVLATPAGTGITSYWNIVVDPGLGTGRQPSAQPFDTEPVNKSVYAPSALSPRSIATSANNNILDGGGGGYGLEADAYSPEVLNFTAIGNRLTNFDYGLVMWEESGATLTSTLSANAMLFNGTGLYNEGGSVDAQLNTFASTTNAYDLAAGNYYNQNCYSDYNGIPPYAIGGGGGNVDNNPSSDCGLNMSPDNIYYNCSGSFTVTVDIGTAVTAMDAANIRIEYPSELNVTGVTAASSNYFLAYTQTSNGAGAKDTLKVNLGVLTGVQDGPATLFTFTMNASLSVCSSNQLKMIYADLRDSTNSQIPAPLASPVIFKSDCNDPDVVVNSPASGGFFNLPPVLNLTATDDCDLNAVYYQIDGCVAGGWVAMATGLSGTTYNAMWTVPGFVGLVDGVHCVRLKVWDDNGRTNADSCSYTWCFTKDVIPPPPPTNLVATPGHNKVNLSWTNASSDFHHTVVMRTDWYAGGHGYPEYDDNNAEGAYPASLVTGDQVYSGTAAVHIDVTDLSNATRDVYHYAAFTVDAAGNASAPSNNARSTSYWLGDMKSPFDGSVYFLDLVVFSSTYGLQQGDFGYNNEADIGPTFLASPKSIPLTDSRVEFEDLVIFAINFDAVSPLIKDRPILVENTIHTDAGLRLVQRTTDQAIEVDMYLDNPEGSAKALIGDIAFDPSTLEYVSANQSANLSGTSTPIFFKALTTPKGVSISAAALGSNTSFGGSGLVATVVFKPLNAGKSVVTLARADVRDKNNRHLVTYEQQVADLGGEAATEIPATYLLEQNQPNPFNPETIIRYGLPVNAQVHIRVYNVMGQLVKTLVNENQPAGQHQVIWNGTNENGERVASGVYLYRFETPDYQKTVKMTLLK